MATSFIATATRRVAILGATAGLAVAGVVAAPTGSAAAAGATSTKTVCEYFWGSLPETNTTMPMSTVRNVRSGSHLCYDRLVIDLRGKAPGYHVRYVTNLTQPGSGQVVPIRGGAKLQVTVNAPAYDGNGNATYKPANRNEIVDVGGYRTFRQANFLGSYEGYSDFGLGVRARLPFRVFTLYDAGTNTSRLVIDVTHQWW